MIEGLKRVPLCVGPTNKALCDCHAQMLGPLVERTSRYMVEPRYRSGKRGIELRP